MCKMKFKQCSMKEFPLSELHDQLGTTKFEEIIPDVQFDATKDEQTTLLRHVEQAEVEVEKTQNEEENGKEKEIEKEKENEIEKEKEIETEIEKEKEKEKGKEKENEMEIEKEVEKEVEKGAIEKPLKKYVGKRVRDVVVSSPDGEPSKRVHTGTVAKLKFIRKGKKGLSCVVPLVRSPIVTRQNKKRDG
ncbi:unnamed protein product [Cochlearia groenlandica]